MEKLKELTHGHALSEDNVLQSATDSPPLQASFAVFPLNKQYLSEIHAGMVWYDDDTVSDEILEGRPIKSVVLAVIGNKVIGDTFVEVLQTWLEARKFAGSFCDNFILRGEASLLSIEELEQVALNRDIFKKTLVLLDLKPWNDYSFYWSASPGDEYNAWLLASEENVRRLFDRAFKMFVRPVIVKIL